MSLRKKKTHHPGVRINNNRKEWHHMFEGLVGKKWGTGSRCKGTDSLFCAIPGCTHPNSFYVFVINWDICLVSNFPTQTSSGPLGEDYCMSPPGGAPRTPSPGLQNLQVGAVAPTEGVLPHHSLKRGTDCSGSLQDLQACPTRG